MELTKAAQINCVCDDCKEPTINVELTYSSRDVHRTCMSCGREYLNNAPLPLPPGRGGREANRTLASRRFNAHKNK